MNELTGKVIHSVGNSANHGYFDKALKQSGAIVIRDPVLTDKPSLVIWHMPDWENRGKAPDGELPIVVVTDTHFITGICQDPIRDRIRMLISGSSYVNFPAFVNAIASQLQK